jgi:hypothetical protein
MVRSGRIVVAPESVPGANPDRVLLINALQKLSRPTRETIVLHHLADMSVHEVAETLGVPVGTVKARLSRGRAMLADLIRDHDSPPAVRAPASDSPPASRQPASSPLVSGPPAVLPPPAALPRSAAHPPATGRVPRPRTGDEAFWSIAALAEADDA